MGTMDWMDLLYAFYCYITSIFWEHANLKKLHIGRKILVSDYDYSNLWTNADTAKYSVNICAKVVLDMLYNKLRIILYYLN